MIMRSLDVPWCSFALLCSNERYKKAITYVHTLTDTSIHNRAVIAVLRNSRREAVCAQHNTRILARNILLVARFFLAGSEKRK